MWTECIAACDAVINSGYYDLLPVFNDVFALENEWIGNAEYIFVIEHRPESGLGFHRQMMSLHYNQLPQSPWNGFSVLADFYNAFDTSDVRIDQLLVGPQVVLGGSNEGDPAFDRNGNPLVFTVDLPSGDLAVATEHDGVRILKWPVDPARVGGNSGNDYAVFRYSHILLAKAEAQFMLGNTGEARELVNQVRERAFDPDKPLTTITLNDILAERGYELLWESFRRQDLIRTGHFFEAWTLKGASEEYRNLFPIPQFQMNANPNLKQNDGYPITGIDDETSNIPIKFYLGQNYPNPFNPSTTITFELPYSQHINLEVFNVKGQKVATLVSEKLNVGAHQVAFNTEKLSSGIYFYRLRGDGVNLVKRMLLIR